MNRGKVAEIVMLVGAGIFLGSIAMAIEELFIRISLLGAVIMFGGVYCGLFYSNTEVRDLQEPVNKLIEGGGGVYGVVVCKDGELTRYFHLIQKIETKGDVVAALSRIAELAFFQFNEKLERKDLS